MNIVLLNKLSKTKKYDICFFSWASSGESGQKTRWAAEQGADMNERELHWTIHVSVITAIPRFQCGIKAPKRLTQTPPPDTEAETYNATITTHRTTSLFSQNKYHLEQQHNTIYDDKKHNIIKTQVNVHETKTKQTTTMNLLKKKS